MNPWSPVNPVRCFATELQKDRSPGELGDILGSNVPRDTPASCILLGRAISKASTVENEKRNMLMN